ncbi:MAG: exodeoxyribonuclease VII large subunit [Treponema sp.]|nr:exodeoxyribonuclease VII large subunit [Treponema sp.]
MSQSSLVSDTVFTVSNLTTAVKDLLEGTFTNITLEGEISNYRPNSTGHLYFTLKDEQSQISAVMFRTRAAYLNFVPKDGMKVRCTGTITVYVPRGNYQINITKMEICGAGNILQILEERKKRLFAEGLFDESRKVKIPVFPKTIGVVTSSTGAALRDILQITKRRNPTVNVVVLPAVVQGEQAAPSIARQIKVANEFNMCDTLIVGRGGGSLEDLLPFSEEIVVRAVAESKIPVISAVGHEIDWAICDYAADYRAPTPSAAAECAVPQLMDIKNDLNYYQEQLYQTIKQKTEKMHYLINSFQPEAMETRFRGIYEPLSMRYENAKLALSENIAQKIKDIKQQIQQHASVLENASPSTIFARGYSMVKNAEGKIIRSNSDVKAGEILEITPAEGLIHAQVIQ